ncbi:MAG: TIR domain-containing protein [Lysobacteraceae bacterium]
MSAIFVSHSSKDLDATADIRAWLDAQGYRSYFLDFDEAQGIAASQKWEQSLYEQMNRSQALLAVITPAWLESKWCFAELVQAREKGKPIFPVKAADCQLDGILDDTQVIDLVTDRAAGFRRLAFGLNAQGLDPSNIFSWDSRRPPFPGLEAHQEADAAIFFGRSLEIQGMRETLDGMRRFRQKTPRLLLVLGPSGSGKSSLVRAGLIPRLRSDREHWLPLRPFRPSDGGGPLESLHSALLKSYADVGASTDAVSIPELLEPSPQPARVASAISRAARHLAVSARRPDAAVLITIDQVEELLAPQSIAEASVFLKILSRALREEDGRLLIVATLRSDFLGTYQAQVGSLDSQYALAHVPLMLDPVPIDRFSEIIHGPARQAGVQVNVELATRLIADSERPDALPLLAFTLRHLYDLSRPGEHSTPRRLDPNHYHALGGLDGAIRTAAENVLKRLAPGPEELAALRHAFIPGLVQVAEDGRNLKRQAYKQELTPAAMRLIEGFVDARLLVAAADTKGHETVEVAHEALLRSWPRLTAWLREDREKLNRYNAVRRAARDWDKSSRERDHLVHRDGRLVDAINLADDARFRFSPGSVEGEYLEVCKEQQALQTAMAENDRERQIRDAQRIAEEQKKSAAAQAVAAGRARIALAIVCVAAVLLGALSVWAFGQRDRAENEAIVSLARSLAANARLLQDRPGADLQTAALLAVESLRQKPTVEGDSAVRSVLQYMLPPVSVAWHPRNVSAVALSADARIVASSSQGGERASGVLKISDALSGAVLAERPHEWQSSSYALVLSPNGAHVALSDDKALLLWNWRVAKTAFRLDALAQVWAENISFSHDSKWLAGSVEGGVDIFDVQTGVPVKHLAIPSAWRSSSKVEFNHAKNEVLFVGTRGGQLIAFDVLSGKKLFEVQATRLKREVEPNTPLAHLGRPNLKYVDVSASIKQVLCSPDGKLVLVADDSRYIHLWNLGDSAPRRVFSVEVGDFIHMAFAASSTIFASAGSDGIVTVWDAASGRPLKSRKLGQSTEGLAVVGDGRYVISTHRASPAILWNWRDDEVVARSAGAEATSISTAGELLVTGESDGAVRIWSTSSKNRWGQRDFDSAIASVEQSPDGTRVAIATESGQLTVSDLAEPRDMLTRRATPDFMQFSDNGQRLATVARSQLTVLDVSDNSVPFRLNLPDTYTEFRGKAAGEDRRVRFIVANGNDVSRLFERETFIEWFPEFDIVEKLAQQTLTKVQQPSRVQREVRMLVGTAPPETLEGFDSRGRSSSAVIDNAALSPDGTRVAVSSVGYMWVFDVDTGARLGRLTLGSIRKRSKLPWDKSRVSIEDNSADKFWFTRTADTLVLKSEAGTLLWDIASGETRIPDQPLCYDSRPTTRGFAWVSTSSQVKIFGPDCQIVAAVEEKGELTALSPDGTLFAITRQVGALKGPLVLDGYTPGAHEVVVWRVGEREPLLRIPFDATIDLGAFSQDSAFFAAASSSGLARVFDLSTHGEVARIAHLGPVTHLEFASTLRQLVTRSRGTPARIRFTPLDSKALIQAVCSRSVRNLQDVEWREYLGQVPWQKSCPDLKH